MKTLTFASLFCCALSLTFGADAKKMDLEQLPAPVRQTIKAQLSDAKLVGIEKDETHDEASYTVQMDRTGKKREIIVGEDGTLLGQEIGIEEAPPEVQKSARAQVAQGKLQRIEKNFEDNEVSYDIEMTTKEGVERSFSVAPDGKLTSIQINLEEAPAAVRKTLLAHVGSGKIRGIYKLLEGRDISYDAEVDHNGKIREVIAAADGTLESIQVGLADVTPEAQKTIKEKIGNGKLVRIDKTFEGGQPYEIEAVKDGKPFKFKVAPKGRFLGKD